MNAAITAAQAAVRPIVIPIGPIGGGAVTAGLAGLVTATAAAETSTLGLASATQIEASALGRLAVPLGATVAATEAATVANEGLAASQTLAAAGAARQMTAASGTTASLLGAGSASGKLDAALLGLRTAAGSAAVIGLSALALGAIAAGKGIRQMLVDTAAFEQELNTFRATAGATAEQMRAVSAAAERLGADVRLPAVSAADAAIAMTELAKAGLSVEDAIAGAEGVLQLATAAQISNAEAAQLAANALNAFGLAGDQAVRVADDLANAANAAQGSIVDIGIAMRQASAVARQVGLSLEDTTAILSLFAKNGLQGSDAGTSLRVALIRLVAPTAKARAEIKALGLDIRDAQGNLRPDIFAQFGEATKDLTPAARDAAAALIFGQDAIRAVSIGAREGRAGLRLMQFQIDQTGTAAELAAARTTGLAGSFAALQSNAQTLGVRLGAAVSGPLQILLGVVNDQVEAVNSLITGLERLAAIRIPEITVDVGFKIHTPSGPVGDFLKKALGLAGKAEAIQIEGPLLAGALFAQDFLDKASSTERRIKTLREELKRLQEARVELGFAEKLGAAEGPADQLTRLINRLKKEIQGLNAEAKGIPTSMADHLRDAAAALRDLGAAHPELNLRSLINSLEEQANIAQHTEGNINRLRDEYGNLGDESRKAAAGVDVLTQSIRANAQESQRSANQTAADILRLQTEGGTSQQIIAAARADIAKQRAVIAEAKKGGIQPGEATTIKKAREQIEADQRIIDSEQSKIDTANRERTQKAQQAARDAATESAKQTQAFIDQFEPRNTALQRLIARAGQTSGLSDDLRFNRILLRRLIAQRKAIADRIRALHLHGDALRIARAAIKALGGQIFDVRQEIGRLTAQIVEDARSARQTHLEAMLSIAETTPGTADDRRALNAIIAFDKAQIARINAIKKKRKLTQDEKAEYDAYRVDLAQRTQALRELTGETEKGKTAAQKLQQAEFAFLQTLTGFTANLIGNLIPGGLTGGLVGGGGAGLGISTPTAPSNAPGPSTLPGGRSPFEHGRGIMPPAVGAPAPASAGQSERQIDWLHRIWQELHKLNRSSDHPEAKHQRRVGEAIGDYEHGRGGM